MDIWLNSKRTISFMDVPKDFFEWVAIPERRSYEKFADSWSRVSDENTQTLRKDTHTWKHSTKRTRKVHYLVLRLSIAYEWSGSLARTGRMSPVVAACFRSFCRACEVQAQIAQLLWVFCESESENLRWNVGIPLWQHQYSVSVVLLLACWLRRATSFESRY